MNAGYFRFKTVSTGDLNRPRSPEVRKPLVYFWFFSYKRKARKTSPSQEASRFFKPQISPPQPQLRTATIKTFVRKFRGFANLETAHRNGSFAPQQLKPFKEDSSFCKPRISTHRQQTRTNQIKSFCRPRRLFLPLRGFFRRPRRLFFRLAAVPCCRRNNSLPLRGFIRRQNRRIIVKFS